MSLPPVSQPPDGADLPGEPPRDLPNSHGRDRDREMDLADSGLADCELAGLDPDREGLDLALLDDRDEPTEAELDGLEPEPDGYADDEGWLAALVSGPSAAFAEDGPLDDLEPGAALAGLSQYALDDGLTALTDDALVGLLRASRRLSAWQSGIELVAVAELDNRRLRESRRPGWSRVSEHVSAELAAALVLTGRSADGLLCLARDLGRLPAVRRALLAGQIDRARAVVFATELSALDDRAANAAAAALIAEAGSLTTGQLRAALRALVQCLDPSAVRRRMRKAREDARVEAWQEGSGNLALAGRELAPADAIAADRRITAIARALQAAGAAGNLDQLRAAVFTALLAGRDPDTLLPGRDTDTLVPGRDTDTLVPDDTDAATPAAAAAQQGPSPEAESRPGGSSGPARLGSAAGLEGSMRGTAAPGWLAGLSGSVHLVLPATTWLGLSDLPGEAAGLGPIDAWTSRDLAARLASAGTKSRWCVTLTHPDGTAAAHACARAGPGPPADPAGRRRWLVRMRFAWLEPSPCSHAQQVPGYRPPKVLSDVIRARNRTCAFPGCRRPAVACDLDHTTPWDQGGRTCPCNLAALCRRHHQVKQTQGWTLTQPEPGVLTWTAPHGRSYTVAPSAYVA